MLNILYLGYLNKYKNIKTTSISIIHLGTYFM